MQFIGKLMTVEHCVCATETRTPERQTSGGFFYRGSFLGFRYRYLEDLPPHVCTFWERKGETFRFRARN